MRTIWVASMLALALPAMASPAALEPRDPPARDPPAREPETRVSDPLVTDEEAWTETGFRVQLRVGYEDALGVGGGAPEGSGLALSLEPGARLSRHLSLTGTLRYSILGGIGFEGLRWSTTADVTWHVIAGAFLAAGGGYGGMYGSTCDGDGAVVLGRAGYLLVVGDLFSTGPVLQADAQRTACKDRSGAWDHTALGAAWTFAWR